MVNRITSVRKVGQLADDTLKLDSGPIGPDQPNSQAWTNGFDHQGMRLHSLHVCSQPTRWTGWVPLTNYYATAWKTGTYPTITTNQIFLFARPHSRDAVINNDPVGKPTNWQWVRPTRFR